MFITEKDDGCIPLGLRRFRDAMAVGDLNGRFPLVVNETLVVAEKRN
jgi:hypothetical protein